MSSINISNYWLEDFSLVLWVSIIRSRRPDVRMSFRRSRFITSPSGVDAKQLRLPVKVAGTTSQTGPGEAATGQMEGRATTGTRLEQDNGAAGVGPQHAGNV